MTDSKDQLFLRLCVRQKIFNKKEATELLRYYRESGGVREDIGPFLVREGYLEQATADQLESAIARRAEGHVADNRKKVPKLNKSRGAQSAHGHHAHHHHHVPSQPQTVAADPLHITMIAGGLIVAIVAVVWIIWEMNKGTSPDDIVAQSQASEEARREERWQAEEEARKAAARDALASANPEKISFSASELEEIDNRVNELKLAAMEASRDLGKGPRRALEILDEGLATLRAERVPPERLKTLEDAREGMLVMRDSIYQRLKGELDSARADGDTDRVAELLDQIKEECGDELHSKAQGG